jgi:hypothetical protein
MFSSVMLIPLVAKNVK